MIGIIMAAGRGKRMGALTKYKPKPLLKIRNKSLLEYSIELLIKLEITNCIITVGYKYEMVKEFIEEYISFKNVRINIKFSECNSWSAPMFEGYLSTLLSVKKFSQYSDFLVLHSDQIFFDLGELKEAKDIFQKYSPDALLIAKQRDKKHFIKVKIRNIENNLFQVVQYLPNYPPQNYPLALGLTFYSKNFWQYIERGWKQNKFPIELALQEGRFILAYMIEGKWFEFNSPFDIKDFYRKFL